MDSLLSRFRLLESFRTNIPSLSSDLLPLTDQKTKISASAWGTMIQNFSLVRSHRSATSLAPNCLHRSLAHLFAPELVGQWNIRVQFSRCFDGILKIVLFYLMPLHVLKLASRAQYFVFALFCSFIPLAFALTFLSPNIQLSWS